MSDMQERPQTLRRTPRPAPDERVDPVDVPIPSMPTATPPSTQASAAPAAQPEGASGTPGTAAARRPGRPRREATVPFSTRLAPEYLQMIDEAAEREGLTIRAITEQAIAHRWGDKA
jgi:hypothetical protein